jgi:hypothetical protein
VSAEAEGASKAEPSKPRLEDKVLADIQKTGFPLELRVAKEFLGRGFYVQHNVYFIDKDEGIGREIEITAYRDSQAEPRKTPPKRIRYKFLVECKKSVSRPWVILSSDVTPFDYEGGLLKVTGLARGISLRKHDLTHISEKHPFWNFVRRGRSYYEAFRTEGDKQDDGAGTAIYKGLTTVVKATLAEIADAGTKRSDEGEIVIHQPMIVLEGKLLEAYLLPGNDIQVAQVPYVPISFQYNSPQYDRHRFSVVVVREEDLPGLLFRFQEVLDEWTVFFDEHPAFVKTSSVK